MITIDDFNKIDIRVGTITNVEENVKAKKPAYKLTIDFGQELGIKISSAQITQNYKPKDLIGIQIIAVVNFPPINVAGVNSEVLVLGSKSKQGIVLTTPKEMVENGDIIY